MKWLSSISSIAGLKNYLIIGSACLAIGFIAGWKVQGWRWGNSIASAYEAELTKQKGQRKKAQQSVREDTEYEDQEGKRLKKIERKTLKRVEIDGDTDIDPELLRLLNEALGDELPSSR